MKGFLHNLARRSAGLAPRSPGQEVAPPVVAPETRVDDADARASVVEAGWTEKQVEERRASPGARTETRQREGEEAREGARTSPPVVRAPGADERGAPLLPTNPGSEPRDAQGGAQTSARVGAGAESNPTPNLAPVAPQPAPQIARVAERVTPPQSNSTPASSQQIGPTLLTPPAHTLARETRASTPSQPQTQTPPVRPAPAVPELAPRSAPAEIAAPDPSRLITAHEGGEVAVEAAPFVLPPRAADATETPTGAEPHGATPRATEVERPLLVEPAPLPPPPVLPTVNKQTPPEGERRAVNVRIGTIEVQATATQQTGAPPVAPEPQGFGDYTMLRTYGYWERL